MTDMVAELMQKINNRLILATILHREMADMFWHIYLPGFALMNEYQYLAENKTQRNLKRYIISTYHILPLDKNPESANVAMPLVGNKNRLTITATDRWEIIRKGIKAHVDWEMASLTEYQAVAGKLLQSGEISVFNYLGDLIADVKKELVFVTDLYLEMQGHDFDIAQITEMQSDLFERFEYLISNLYRKSQKFHHWNSAYDPISRVDYDIRNDGDDS